MKLNSLVLPFLGAVVVIAILWSESLVHPKVVPGPVHITYWEKWSGFEGDAMRAVVNHFNKIQDKVFVDMLQVSAIQDKTLLAVAGDIPPDVAGLYGPNVAQYADDNAVIPLDDYCRKFNISRDDYIPVYFDIGVYRDHVYSLPTTPASTALHYNTDEFKAAGLDPDKPPKTIEEMDTMVDKLTIRNSDGTIKQSGFMHAEPGWWNWMWGPIFGGKLIDENENITANSPDNVRGFEWVQSYAKKYGVTTLQTFRSGFGTFSSPENAFMSGRVAMELQGVWMANFISQFNKDRHWKAAPFPYPADRPDLANSTMADEDVLVIPRGAKHPDEAFEFIRYVQSQEGMEMLCMGQKKHTPLKKVSDEFLKNHPNPYIKLFTDLPRGKTVLTTPKIGLWPEYQAELNNAFDEINLLQKTPKQALDNVQAVMQTKMNRYNAVLRKRGILK